MKESAPKKLEVLAVSSFWGHQLSTSLAKSQRWRNIYVLLLSVSNRSSRRWNPLFFSKLTNRALSLQANYVTVSGGVYNLVSHDRKSREIRSKQMGTKASTNIGVSSADVGRRRVICFPSKWLGLIEKKTGQNPQKYSVQKEREFARQEGETKCNLILTLVSFWLMCCVFLRQ